MSTNPKLHHYALSDLHLGHDKILDFCRPWFKDPEALEKSGYSSPIEFHDSYIINKINETCPSTEDYLWLLGDVAFSRKALMRLSEVKCKLALIGGNHDLLPADTYLKVFEQVRGVAQMNHTKSAVYHGNGSFSIENESVLFSHIPMHPEQMRWGRNIHGHLHTFHVGDDRYINACCEPLEFTPKKIGDLLVV